MMTPIRAFLSRWGTVKLFNIVASSDRYVGKRARLGTPTISSRSFTDENGNIVRTLEAGIGSALRFTNLTTGNTFATKSNGAVSHITFNPDGSSTQKLAGHNVLILFPTDNPPGPSTTLTAGRLVFTVDTTGVFTVQDVSGKTTDLRCLALTG